MINKYHPSKINREQSKDAALALILIFLLVGIYQENNIYYKISISILIIAMIYPLFFRYFASIWYSSAQLLGEFVSRLILTIIFFMVVSPIGVARKLFGYDSLKLNQFKNGSDSVMKIRNHIITKNNLENPY